MIFRPALIKWTAFVAVGVCAGLAGCEDNVKPDSDDDGGEGGGGPIVTSSTAGGAGGKGGEGGVGGMGGAGGQGGAGGAGGQSGPCNQQACSPKDPACNQVTSCCIALADNQGAATAGLRISQLTFAKPALLVSGGLVGNLVANSVQMNLDQCNLAGGGTFSWLLQFDPAKDTLRTGGAKPAADPFGGYCFVNELLGGLAIAPVEVQSGLASGSFAAGVGDMIVPIFLDASASQYVLLPLKGGKLTGELSGDSNCIGAYNANKLDPANNCIAEPPDKLQFTNAGTLDAAMTLEDADAIIVDALAQSLCVLLSGNAAMYGNGMSLHHRPCTPISIPSRLRLVGPMTTRCRAAARSGSLGSRSRSPAPAASPTAPAMKAPVLTAPSACPPCPALNASSEHSRTTMPPRLPLLQLSTVPAFPRAIAPVIAPSTSPAPPAPRAP
jgi:hypothetical protein